MKRILGTRVVMLLAAALLGPLRPGVAGEGEPDFTRDVRPILAKNCFKCHGPDEKTRKGGLRLDVREAALAAAIVPGQPGKSELMSRIHAGDPAKVMPPPSTKIQLTTQQKDVLQRWIAAGAKYQKHWAFVPPRQPTPPKVMHKEWVRNAIDAFILARLEAAKLSPSPPADRTTLIRRLSLDLIGLPPMPEEVDAFLQDASPRAYEALVERLLASPHYGERWARRWLDLARYADTNGYEKDRARTIWPYRDWVIQALNDDMPFDRFTIEQIAGDMLPRATPEQIVATGFHRNTMINEEGGIDPLEFRYYAVVDRTNTTATAWLGLTFGCAQCHSHKYDPITQRDYYRMFAYLNNADEPDYAIPQVDIVKQRTALQVQIAKLNAELPDRFPGGAAARDQAFQKWQEGESAKAAKWTLVRPTTMKTNKAHLDLLEDGSILAGGDQTKSDTYEITFTADIPGVTALRLEVLPHDSLPDHGPGRTYYEGRKGDFFLSELSLAVNGTPLPFSGASHDYAQAAFGASKVGAAYCFDGLPNTGWSTTDQPGKAHQAVFYFDKPVHLQGAATLKMLFERHYACGLGRFRLAVTTAPRRAEASVHGEPVQSILARPVGQRTQEDNALLLRRFLEVAPEVAAARKEIDALRAALPSYPVTMVMKERDPKHPRTTHLHHRGEFLQPKEKVTPGVPAFLAARPQDWPRNRLEFARWLVAAENPLTARVAVNRQWQALFGRGLVKTVEDVGLQGDLPTHPELLDWLAVEFVRQGWSMKKLHKLIVMSAAYQQSSHVTPELLKQDPDNQFLTRGPRVRLEAELIRDSLLRASGQLSTKMGGPSVFPPQPPALSTEGVYGAIKWTPSAGEDRYRRGLYTFLKRSIPYGMFSTFDGVTGENCLARREISNTPLQALTMLNDPVVIDAAQALAGKVLAKKGTTEERLTLLFRRCLGRTPTAMEQTTLRTFFQHQVARLSKGEVNAKTIAGPGESDVLERAAWTLTARAVFNLDEMITKE
jgi:hypothetical protein